MRGMAAAELERGGNTSSTDEKLRLLERVLSKIQEFDRLILKKTAPLQADIAAQVWTNTLNAFRVELRLFEQP